MKSVAGLFKACLHAVPDQIPETMVVVRSKRGFMGASDAERGLEQLEDIDKTQSALNRFIAAAVEEAYEELDLGMKLGKSKETVIHEAQQKAKTLAPEESADGVSVYDRTCIHALKSKADGGEGRPVVVGPMVGVNPAFRPSVAIVAERTQLDVGTDPAFTRVNHEALRSQAMLGFAGFGFFEQAKALAAKSGGIESLGSKGKTPQERCARALSGLLGSEAMAGKAVSFAYLQNKKLALTYIRLAVAKQDASMPGDPVLICKISRLEHSKNKRVPDFDRISGQEILNAVKVQGYARAEVMKFNDRIHQFESENFGEPTGKTLTVIDPFPLTGQDFNTLMDHCQGRLLGSSGINSYADAIRLGPTFTDYGAYDDMHTGLIEVADSLAGSVSPEKKAAMATVSEWLKANSGLFKSQNDPTAYDEHVGTLMSIAADKTEALQQGWRELQGRLDKIGDANNRIESMVIRSTLSLSGSNAAKSLAELEDKFESRVSALPGFQEVERSSDPDVFNQFVASPGYRTLQQAFAEELKQLAPGVGGDPAMRHA